MYLSIAPCEMEWGLMDDPFKVSESMIEYQDPTKPLPEYANGVRPSWSNQTIISTSDTAGKITITFANRYVDSSFAKIKQVKA